MSSLSNFFTSLQIKDEYTFSVAPLPSPAPSTLEPSPAPQVPPTTREPTPEPTLPNTEFPTPEATTIEPTPLPTTAATTLEPTEEPTAVTTLEPTPLPTLEPNALETLPPTAEPQVSCLVEVELACTTSDGLPCEELTDPPNLTCATGEAIEFVTFTYNDRSCDGSANKQGDEAFCEDNVPITFFDPVTILCRDGDENSLTVEPTSVAPLGTFTVSVPGGGALPQKIDCIILDVDGSALQQNIIDTSGTVQLDLKDSFGALTLESCAEDKSCLETLIYDVTLSNVGTVDMEVTVADFFFGGQTTSLLGDLEINPLAPDESTTLQQQFENIDVCGGFEVTALANVEATPPNGDMCQDSVRNFGMSVCIDIAL